MARIARVVVPDVPHHVIQRGNRRLRTFFKDEDYEAYIDLMARWSSHWGVEIWAYCLMPNHVHLIAVPSSENALMRAIGEAHRRYTVRVNLRENWRGHLWQGRFASFPMDEAYLFACVRYVELNPVRAGLVSVPWQYRWSSAAARVRKEIDPLTEKVSLLDEISDWKAFLMDGLSEEKVDDIRLHARTGRPLGKDEFQTGLETALGRTLQPQKRGPKGPRKNGERGSEG